MVRMVLTFLLQLKCRLNVTRLRLVIGKSLDRSQCEMFIYISLGLQQSSDLHGQNSSIAVTRPFTERSSDRFHRSDSRSKSECRSRISLSARWNGNIYIFLSHFNNDKLNVLILNLKMSTMPGLPTRPAIFDIDLNLETGNIEGLF